MGTFPGPSILNWLFSNNLPIIVYITNKIENNMNVYIW
jgi:hypothetical protein